MPELLKTSEPPTRICPVGRTISELPSPLIDVLVIHRHGRMLPGEPIVLVAVSSAHRQAAFEACQFLMDWLKTKAPFWKLEETSEGAEWVAARTSDEAAADRWKKTEP